MTRMSDPADVDQQSRVDALDPARSFIVQAPAGSGKTTVLTQRYLSLLACVDEPEQVLAITFTRKAAGEMRERVRKALEGRIEPKSDAERLTLELAARVRARAIARDWGIDTSAARLRIQTIDAFNGYLAKSLPITSRSGFATRIADNPDDLYALAARETMRGADRDPTLHTAFALVQNRLDNSWKRLEELIASMLPRRGEWLPNMPRLANEKLVPRIEASLRAIVAQELESAARALGPALIEEGAALARVAARHVDAAAKPDIASWRDAGPLTTEVNELSRWRGIAALALTNDGELRKRITRREGIPADEERAANVRAEQWLAELEAAEAVPALCSIGCLPDVHVPQDARAALDALAELLVLATLELTRLFGVHGERDHTAVAGAARQALTEDSSPTPLAERLGTRLMHILVDEFQDTSREQYELLRTLTFDWSPGDGRTLFLVGDPMQSIYGFRNAEVGRFATVRESGLGTLPLEALELRRNFRSAPGVIKWCNQVFARVFPPSDDPRSGSVRHLASVAARAELSGGPRLYRVEGTDAAATEGAIVADVIEELRTTCPGQSIAILASARGHLRRIRAALAERRVPFVGVKLEPLADVSLVRDLEALARALDAPLDRIAWLAVLRAPFIGLDLPDLTTLANAAADGPILGALQDESTWNDLSVDGRARLTRAAPLLIDGWRQRERESWAQRVERVWLALAGPATTHRAAELAHTASFFAALAEAEELRLRGRAPDLERLMARLYAVESESEPGAVSLMTVHGAKGLEFDHVIVAGVGRRLNNDPPRLLNWIELPRADGADDLLMAPIRNRADDDREADAINRYIARLNKERLRAERSRQAYVAFTRARIGVHVFVHLERRSSGELAPGANTLLANLWPALSTTIEALPALAIPASRPAAAPARCRLLPESLAVEVPSDIEVRGRIDVSPDAEDAIEFSWARETARRVGTVVHEALEWFGREGLPDAAQLERRRVLLEARLQALGIEEERARHGAGRALDALQKTIADERGRWLFDPEHRAARSELALSGLRGEEVINVIIDRTFVTRGGVRWVVDFKTSLHEGANLRGFLDSEMERYTPQLRRYVMLAARLGPEPVRAGLYFPLLGQWREVPIEAA